MNDNNPTAALKRAILNDDRQAIRRETEKLMQAMAFDLCRVSSKYGPDFHGVMMVVTESFLEILRQIADQADLQIYETLRERTTSITVDSSFAPDGKL